MALVAAPEDWPHLGIEISEASAAKIERGGGRRNFLGTSQRTRAAKIIRVVAQGTVSNCQQELLCRAAVRLGNRRPKSPFAAGTESPVACNHRDWQRRTGETRLLFAREFVLSAGDPLHRGGARFSNGRPVRHSRLGGPVVFRMASATDDSAAPLRSAPSPWIGIAVADRALWKRPSAASFQACACCLLTALSSALQRRVTFDTG